MYLKKLPRFKPLPHKEMKIRKEWRDMEDRMKMCNVHLVGVVGGTNLKNELRKNSWKLSSTNRNGKYFEENYHSIFEVEQLKNNSGPNSLYWRCCNKIKEP